VAHFLRFFNLLNTSEGHTPPFRVVVDQGRVERHSNFDLLCLPFQDAQAHQGKEAKIDYLQALAIDVAGWERFLIGDLLEEAGGVDVEEIIYLEGAHDRRVVTTNDALLLTLLIQV